MRDGWGRWVLEVAGDGVESERFEIIEIVLDLCVESMELTRVYVRPDDYTQGKGDKKELLDGKQNLVPRTKGECRFRPALHLAHRTPTSFPVISYYLQSLDPLQVLAASTLLERSRLIMPDGVSLDSDETMQINASPRDAVPLDVEQDGVIL